MLCPLSACRLWLILSFCVVCCVLMETRELPDVQHVSKEVERWGVARHCFIPLLWYWFALVAFVCYDWSQAKDLLISTAAPLTASLRTIATIPSTTSLGFFFLFVHLFVQVGHACEIKYLNKLYTFYRSFHWLFEFDQAGQRFDSQLK